MAESGDKVDASADVTELNKKIIKQVEYYFGDLNLARDKFLREEITRDDGWVTLETMLNFNRLKSMTQDVSVVAEALRNSELMEVSQDSKKIRRSPAKPLVEPSKDDLKLKSVYAKGFPLDVTLDQLMEFFEKFGRTENIQMRKDMKKKFKGSCFVVYADKESAKNFVETPDVKYNDAEMIRLLKDDYFKRKTAERKQKSEDKAKKSDELKKEKEKKEKEKLMLKITPGAILNIEGIPKSTKREDIKEFFQKYGAVEWVDFEIGDTKSRVRFGGEDSAKGALEKVKEANEGKVTIGEVEVQCRVLEGDEELEHWANIYKVKRDKQTSNKDRKKKRRGDRRGGPQRKRGKPFHGKGKEDSDNEKDDDDDDDGDE